MLRSTAAGLLLLSVALAGCSGGSSRDSDGDGIYDAQEKNGWRVIVDLVDRRVERMAASDPRDRDTDDDGLSDLDEFRLIPPLDPTVPDTDGDGLTDCQESFHSVLEECQDAGFDGPFDGGTGTDATKADSDPGYSRYVTRVLGFEDETGTLGGTLPTWGDGIPDGEEMAGYDVLLPSGASRFVRTDPRNADSDDDDLEDGEERFQYGSDPRNADTDGDGCADGHDPYPAFEDRYKLQLGTFRLLADQDATGGADLRLELTFAENSRLAPASGSREVETGQDEDLSALSGVSVRPPECNYAPHDPWILIQVAATDVDPTEVQELDIDSRTPNRATMAQVWWNTRDGDFAWNGREGSRFDGPVTFRGLDAELTLSATVLGG